MLTWSLHLAPLPPAQHLPAGSAQPRVSSATTAPTAEPVTDSAQARALVLVEAMARPLTEVLTGARATGQLARWIGPASLDRLGAAVRVGNWHRVAIRSIHASTQPTGPDDIPGIWGRIGFDCDGQPLTSTLHLACHAGRWRCTCLDLLLPGSHLRVDEAT